ncbi:hypothetical protein ACFLW3_01440, partial [Chloroflexota bacterium]
PVVIWKGGRTEAGARVIASHTASLATSQSIWNTAIRQAGAVNVANLEELIDTLKALLYLPPVRGDRVAIAGGSGGQSVAVTDAFTEAGLKIPLFTQKTLDEFATFLTLIGGSYRNPVDTGNANRAFLDLIMQIVAQDTNIDNLVLLLWPQGSPHPRHKRNYRQIQNAISSMTELRQKTPKPLMAILPLFSTPLGIKQTQIIRQKLQAEGILAFATAERGARALKNALEYYQSRVK